MPTIIQETIINAPVERCFDLARDIGLHCESTGGTSEKAVAGVTTGLIGPGETVTFEATHFGVRQRLTSHITEFDSPHRFVDEMLPGTGAFHSLHHLHEFEPLATGTLMRDTMTYVSPLGWLGILADKLFLESYMMRFLRQRNAHLKSVAESAP